MGRSRRLSASFVRTVKQPGRYGDGHGGYGLSLFVKKLATGRLSKTWSQRIQINGRVTNLGLGVFPVVTLAEAREQALEHRRAVVQGRDPRGRGIPTFAQAADKVIAIHRATWKPGTKSEQHWRGTLRHHVLPRIGRKRVDQITTADVMGVLLADDFWNRRNATAKRARQRIAAVMKWSVAKGYREDNPAGDAIAAALPKHNGRVQHHRALSHAGVAAALAKVRASSSNPGTQLALELLVLTACRSAEVRGARWEEIDLEAATWTIPGGRMKTGKTHRVPLSARALEVLAAARALAPRSPLVFPGSRAGRPLSGKTLSVLARPLGCVPHGFRTSFRNWCGETGVPREVAERCLAHVVRNQVERAYARSDLLERRREVMEAWSDYLAARTPSRVG